MRAELAFGYTDIIMQTNRDSHAPDDEAGNVTPSHPQPIVETLHSGQKPDDDELELPTHDGDASERQRPTPPASFATVREDSIDR